jgi:hypothetical protein
MQVTLVDAIVLAVAGMIGGIAAGTAIRAQGFRTLFFAAVGAIGGVIGGLFLHAQILVNGAGQPNIGASSADEWAMRALAGFIAGGLLALILSVLNLFKDEHINK